ncbi:hypothetical protein Tco_0808610 [Tanacetum coccineum]
MPIWKDASYFDDASPRSVADAQIQDQIGYKMTLMIQKTQMIASLRNNDLEDYPALKTPHVEVQEMNWNIPQSYEVPTTPHTRIHKDHPIEHVIGDVKSSVQTRRMKTSYSEKGFLSDYKRRADSQDIQYKSYLFVSALRKNQKRVSQAHRDPAWVEECRELFSS